MRRRPDDIYACPVTPSPAARWIARNIIGNEVNGNEPLPLSLRAEIAQAMVNDGFLGWPDVETADVTLDDWEWDQRA